MRRAWRSHEAHRASPAHAAVAAAGAESGESRTLDHDFLLGKAPLDAPVSTGEFAPPEGAGPPRHAFNGRLTLSRERLIGAMRVWRDDYGTAKTAPQVLQHLPEFDFEFVTSGDVLLPVERGAIASEHPQWEYVLEPGRVWSEPDDRGLTRAALPFSLAERNANCVHNGLLTFLYDTTGRVSRAAYQVASETCLYLKIDLWGALPARYRPGAVGSAAQVVAAYEREHAARLPVRPIEALARDHPGARPEAFGNTADVPAADMTAYGFVIDGVHYVGGCQTRQGPYPYCDVLDLPSYSLAKSLVAGLGSLALAREFPAVLDEHIADYVPACKAAGDWADVRFRDALDMATGHYDSTRYDDDEKSAAMLPFFIAEDHLAKIAFACGHFPRRAPPGTQWVYHTIAPTSSAALRAFVQAPRRERISPRYRRRGLWDPLALRYGCARRGAPATSRGNHSELGPHPASRRHARIGALLVAAGAPRIAGQPLFDDRRASPCSAIRRSRAACVDDSSLRAASGRTM